jgi:hypothetical protein
LARDENADIGVAAVDAKEKAKRRIEEKTGMQTDKPAVLLNGRPVSAATHSHPEGIVEKKKTR